MARSLIQVEHSLASMRELFRSPATAPRSVEFPAAAARPGGSGLSPPGSPGTTSPSRLKDRSAVGGTSSERWGVALRPGPLTTTARWGWECSSPPYVTREAHPADVNFWGSMKAACFVPIDDEWDSKDLTPLSDEDLWQALVGPEPVAQSWKQHRNSWKKRSQREQTARKDIVSGQNPAALLAAWLGYEGTEPSPPQAALPSG